MRCFVLLVLCFTPLISYAQLYRINNVNFDACGFSVGWVGTKSGIENACIGSSRNGKKVTSVSLGFPNCSWATLRYGSGKYDRDPIAFFACKIATCPSGTVLDPETGKCESPCKKLEGNSLGTVTFPVGSSQVNAVCNNSCKATLLSGSWISSGIQNDPRPFGHYNYSGQACDGSEGSGGETGSGGDGSGSGGDGSGSGGDGSGSGGDGSGSGGDGSGSGGDGSGSDGDGSGSDGDGSGSGGDGSGSGGDGSGSGGDGSGSGGDGSGSGGGGSGSGGGGSGSGGGGSGSDGDGSGSDGDGSGSDGDGSGSDGDGLTKGDIKDAIKEALGKSGTFTSPANGEGYGSGTALTGSVAALQTEVEELEDELKRKLKKSPLKLGQMSFSSGSYDGTSFNLSRWDVDVGFNLFSSLGVNNTDMIRTVILFIATLFAGFILLSSGRSKV